MWWYVAAFVVGLVVAYAAAPKPKSSPPAELGDIDAPTAEEGREIPVLFGTRDINGPNVVWFGDFRTEPIRKKGGKK